MKTDPNDSAYPIPQNILNDRFGFTKRELLAAMNFADGVCRGAAALIAVLSEGAE